MHARILRLAKTTTLALAMISCGGGTADSGPSEPGPTKASMAGHMHENFKLIDQIRTAVVGGELKEAKTRATELGDNLLKSEYPQEWMPHLQRVREVVSATKGANDLASAAIHAARAGSACGRCHAALGADGLPESHQPLELSSLPLAEFMNRHSWAAERLWEGLVGPSDELWKLGSKTLAETAQLATDNMSPEMQTLAYSLSEISERSSIVVRVEEREEVYGELLSTCAACHRAYNNTAE